MTSSPSAKRAPASLSWPKTWSVPGPEKVLTKNGSSYVALVDAKRLDYYHALELEHAGLVLLAEAETALRQVLAGERIDPAALDELLAD